MNNKKILKIIIEIAVLFAVLIVGVLIGGKGAEIDINKRVANGEIFGNVDVKSLCQNNDSKNCNDNNQNNIQSDVEIGAAVQDNSNRIDALRKIGEDLAKPYVEGKLKDIGLYKKLNVKSGEEFLSSGFDKNWDSEYLLKYKQEFSDAGKLREQVIKGDIFEQDLVYGSVYYAKNYFNWDIEKLKNMTKPLCDGLGCNVPEIISADSKSIYWTTLDCSGGAKPEDADQKFYYNTEMCSTVLNAMLNYSKQ